MARNPPRYLLAVLGLLIPVATLAWLGSAELGRQQQRASAALVEHAKSVLDEVDREFRRIVATRARRIHANFDARFEPLVALEARERTANADVLGLVVLDEDGNLLYPVTPPEDAFSLPFVRPSSSPEVRAAERLLAAGDHDGARRMLEDWLETRSFERRGPGAPPRSSRQRAWFRLASLQLRSGALDEAERAFGFARRSGRPRSETAALPLLCDVATAEIACLRDAERGVEQTLDVMRRVAFGEHYTEVGDSMLAGTIERLRDLVSRSATSAFSDAAIQDADELVATNRVRELGRAFARGYDDEQLRDAFRRRVRDAAEGDPEIRIAHDDRSSDQPSMLAIRRIRENERENAPLSLGPRAHWIGLRFAFGRWFELATTQSGRGGRDAGFLVAVETASGAALLPRQDAIPTVRPTLPVGFEPPTRTSVGGARLRAEPTDLDALTRAEARSRWTRLLLILALCGVAGGGALLLVRTARRESEVATLKMELVSRVSHELKTPIALIKMYAETIGRSVAGTREGAQRDEAERADATSRYAGIIDREADRLTAMVQRILDFARIDAQDARPEELDLTALLRDVVDEYAPRAEARGVPIETEGLEGPAIHVRVDRSMCASACLNLLENAVKYTLAAGEQGADAPAVSVDLRVDGKSAVWTVADRGIGIPENELERVFESFYRASNAKEAPGVGLGLGIVRAFFDAHHGTIRADGRQDGPGTIITCSLPIHRSEPSHA